MLLINVTRICVNNRPWLHIPWPSMTPFEPLQLQNFDSDADSGFHSNADPDLIFSLKVHKIEIFFGFDFEICIISLLVM